MDAEANGITAAPIRAPVSADEYEPSKVTSSSSDASESDGGYETASDSEEDDSTAAASSMPGDEDEVPDEEEQEVEDEDGEVGGDEPEAVARVPPPQKVGDGDDVTPNLEKPDENGGANDFVDDGVPDENTKIGEQVAAEKSDGEKSPDLGELNSSDNIEEGAESKPLEASNASGETKEPEKVEASRVETVENGGPESTEAETVAEHVGGERDGASELPNIEATGESVEIEGLNASAFEKDSEGKAVEHVGDEAEIPNAEAAGESVVIEGLDSSAVEESKAVEVAEASVEAEKDKESKAMEVPEALAGAEDDLESKSVEVPEASVEAEKDEELKAVEVPEASVEAEKGEELKAVEVPEASVEAENDVGSKAVEVSEPSVEPEKVEAVDVDNTSSSKEDSSKPVEEAPNADQDEAVEAGDVARFEQKHSEDVDDSEAKHDVVSGVEASLNVEGAEKDESLIKSSPTVEEKTKDIADVGADGDSNIVQVQENENVEGQEETAFTSVVKDVDAGEEATADGDEKVLALEDKNEPVVAGVSSENENDSLEVDGESPSGGSVADRDVKPEADVSNAATDGENVAQEEDEEEEEGAGADGPARVAILESSDAAKQIIKELEEGSSGDRSPFDGSRNVDGQIVTDSDEYVDTDEEGDGKELFDSAALTALLKAAAGVSSDSNSIGSADASRIFSVDRPAGLGSSAPSLKPNPARSTRPNLFAQSDLAVLGEAENSMDEEERKLHEKVEQIRVKFLRLVQRLGHSPEDTVAAQVLYRLSLAEGIRHGRQISRAFSLENAKKKALQLEADGAEDLDFNCNILVLGKTGVGKSATINSIFGMEKSKTNAFELATTSVREISGVVDGVKIRIVDTPGLRASAMDQASNRKILSNIKKYTKRCPPDIVLYVDRLDTQTRDFNDLPLLRTITSTLGSSIWFNAIVALTHGASAPPDGPNGSPLSYDVFIAQRSHVVQQSIRQAAGDMRLMNPVALVENHPSCRRNREGQRILPNGLSWRPQMLLLCYSSKILSEANALLKLQDPSPGKLFGFRLRSPPLPFLLSSLLQTRQHPKLANDQGIDNGDSDIDLDDLSDADQDEDEDDYDSLPPFKPLKKSQIAKLSKEQRKSYYEEYDYRVKLLQKKQWKEEIRRLKEMKKRSKTTEDNSAYGDMADDYDQDGAPAAVPVPLPDMVLPPSFDCDNPAYRYRFLEPTSQLLTRPVLDTHGWDHDCGYDGVSLEESLALAGRFPAAVAVQITKDKKEFNIHLDSSISAKHGDNGSTLAGFDIQSVGRQLAYILRSETKFKNMKKNKTTAGMSVTFLGETVATGLKVEDQITLGKRVSLVASTGAIRAQGDTAYGANLEARLREKDYPIGQVLSTLGLSLMRWRGDLALGANLQSQFSVGRNSKISVRAGLNNKLSGQITVKTSTSEQLQIAIVGILPVAASILKSIWPNEAYVVN